MCLLELWFFQGICPVVGLLGHMVVQFLVFKETPYFSPLWLYQSTIPILILDVSNTRTFLDHFSCEHSSHLLQACGGGLGA